MLDATEEGYVTADGRKIGGVVMEMKNITLKFGGVTAIKDISFDIREGEIRAIIGPNGAGKSSMLQAAGLHLPLGEPQRSARLGNAACNWWVFENGVVIEPAAGVFEREIEAGQAILAKVDVLIAQGDHV